MRMQMFNALILAATFVGGMTVNQYFNEPEVETETKIVKVEVDKLPDDIGIAIKNPVTGASASLACSNTVGGDYDFDTAIHTEDMFQTYVCKKGVFPE